MADGSRHELSIVLESNPGNTPATPSFKKLRQTGATITLNKENFQSAELRADRNVSDIKMGAEQVGGDVSAELSYGTYDEVLEALLMGTWAAGVPAAGKDQLKNGVTRRAFTVERNFTDLTDKPYFRYRGCEFSSASIEINANANVTSTFSVVGRGADVPSATAITGATYANQTTTKVFDSFTGTLLEGGSPAGCVTSVSLTIENGLEAQYGVGNKSACRISAQRFVVNGTLTVYFENASMVEKFINETESSVDLTLTDLAGNALRMHLPRVVYTGAPLDVSGEGSITVAMPFQAVYHAASGCTMLLERDPA